MPEPALRASEDDRDSVLEALEGTSNVRHLVLIFVIAFVTLAALLAMILLHP